jgi:hypothetical protein
MIAVLEADAVHRASQMAPQQMTFWNQFVQRLGVSCCCTAGGVRTSFPPNTRDLNYQPQDPRFKIAVRSMLAAQGAEAATLRDTMLPLALVAPPSHEASAVAHAMAGSEERRTAITIITRMVGLQIQTAKLVTTYLCPEMFKSDVPPLAWVEAMTGTKDSWALRNSIMGQNEPTKEALEAHAGIPDANSADKQIAVLLIPFLRLFPRMTERVVIILEDMASAVNHGL